MKNRLNTLLMLLLIISSLKSINWQNWCNRNNGIALGIGATIAGACWIKALYCYRVAFGYPVVAKSDPKGNSVRNPGIRGQRQEENKRSKARRKK
jgi:hypothetical protein